MKPETTERLRLCVATALRAAIASTWIWEGQPAGDSSVQKNRRMLQRAARKAEGDPIGFVEKYLGWDWKSYNAAKFPERAAVVVCELLEILEKRLTQSQDTTEFFEGNRRKVLSLASSFFGSLAAQPGRPAMSKYRSAAALRVLNPKLSAHNLCKKFELDYPSMSKEDQRKARQKMRAGVRRVLKAGTNSPS